MLNTLVLALSLSSSVFLEQDPSLGDLITEECASSSEELVQVKKDYVQAKKESDTTKTRLALFALLSAICKVLLSLTKLVSPFFKSQKGKTAVRLSTLGVGVFVFLFSHLAAGESWLDSIILGACGPFSIVVHEYTKLLFSKKEEKDGETVAGKEGEKPGANEPPPG